MTQVSRNLTDADDGCLRGKRFLIHDRDPRFTVAFRETLAAAGVQVVRLPPRSPNLNAHAERFVRTIKESCLDRMILFGEESLRTAIHNFVAHYNCASLCPPRYVADKSRSPWPSSANAGARLSLCARSTSCTAV